jgi:pilus assembly protein Flp/PilA
MGKWLQKLVQFLQAEEGPTAVEYAVMLALIVVACLVAITALGTAANKTFGDIALQTATAGT